jgi:hypothetical protein
MEMKQIWAFPKDDQSRGHLESGLEAFSRVSDTDLMRVVNLKGEEEELPLVNIPEPLLFNIKASIQKGSDWSIRIFSQDGDDALIKEEEIVRRYAPAIRATKRQLNKVQRRKK